MVVIPSPRSVCSIISIAIAMKISVWSEAHGFSDSTTIGRGAAARPSAAAAPRSVGLMQRCRDECGDVGEFPLAGQPVVMLYGEAAQEVFFRAPEEELDQAAAYPFMKPVFGPGVVFDATPSSASRRSATARCATKQCAATPRRSPTRPSGCRRLGRRGHRRPARLLRRAHHLHVERRAHRPRLPRRARRRLAPLFPTSSAAPTRSPT